MKRIHIDRNNADKIDSLEDCHVRWVPTKTVEEGELRPYRMVVESYWSDSQGGVGDFVVFENGKAKIQ